MDSSSKEIIMYTDGGCEPNPGAGGYGVVLIYEKSRKELSSGYRLTTNNRMELLAVIKGLEALKNPSAVRVFSDSAYVVRAMTEGWVARWKARGWHSKKNKMAANHDLWIMLDSLCQKHQVAFHWVKGHANIAQNERCDQLAMRALKAEVLLVDEFYENLSDIDPESFQWKRVPSRPTVSGERVTQEGQPCRKCATPVVKKIPKKTHKPGQKYYFAYYFYCPRCRTMYMVDEAKRFIAK